MKRSFLWLPQWPHFSDLDALTISCETYLINLFFLQDWITISKIIVNIKAILFSISKLTTCSCHHVMDLISRSENVSEKISSETVTNHAGCILQQRGAKLRQQGHISVTISGNDGNEGICHTKQMETERKMKSGGWGWQHFRFCIHPQRSGFSALLHEA